MGFLSKNYEKFILTIFLVFFVVALVWQLGMIMQAQKVKDDDLNLERRKDYGGENMKDFNIVARLAEQPTWKGAVARSEKNAATGLYTDLTEPIPATRCPYCNGVIPTYDFTETHKCSLCGAFLPAPPTGSVEPENVADTDKDGIPDKIEEKYGLDPNVADAKGDKDGDSFSNIYEYDKARTDLANPKSHPELVTTRLMLVGIKPVPLLFKVKKVSKRGDKKADWEIQMEVKSKGKWKTRFLRLGKTVKTDTDVYKIVGVEHKEEERLDHRINDTRLVDASIVTLVPLDDPAVKINAKVGQTVFAPKAKVWIKDVSTGAKIVTKEGGVFRIGSPDIGTESCRVDAVDAGEGTVVIDSGGKKTTLRKGEDKDVGLPEGE